ncbi:MAG: aldehyde ferredoxin oxidoreductase family protein [Dehalococcoidales bacterium]|nr:aldehyde ferredoxin oxidoreductase family protein [Dehalococcoidales bacterium]
MAGGYIGKLLFVDLSTGKIEEETPEESICRDFIGGYGLGARILYSRQKARVDALGPENTLGILTGPLTGTPTPLGCRYVVIGKSPLTGGWGDANCGGYFGPHMKFAGYDGVFLTGISPEPVYLLIDNGRAQLREASHLWGKDIYETENTLQSEHGKTARVISIGLAGEKQSLVACIITEKGSAAGRSGLGAVMGSKKLKAVVVKGEGKVPVADAAAVEKLRKEYLAILNKTPARIGLHEFGTPGHTDNSAHSGDTPVKNWGGVGVIDLPDVSGLRGEMFNANLASRHGCWRCPVICRGTLNKGQGEYKYPAGTKRPEYETAASFGAMCLNTNAEAIAMVNHICNSYGVDTISTGTIISFAMELYEHGIITKKDTDGIELKWGDHHAMVAMTEKLAKREGFGAVLADGVKKAAERIGKGAGEFAVHIGGQELGMHDPRFDFPGFAGMPTAARYQMDATPGRHTAGFGPSNFGWLAINAAGLCLHINTMVDGAQYAADFLAPATGWQRSLEEVLKCGERIGAIRHVFTLREGDNPLERKVHGRIIGEPPQTEGPLAGVTTDLKEQVYWNLGALDWDRVSTRPSRKKLMELGLKDAAEELWPQQKKA